MLKRWIFGLLAGAALAQVSVAQGRIGFGRPVHGGPMFGSGITFTARSHPLGSRGFYLGETPYFYDDYPFQSFAAEPATPQVTARRLLIDDPKEKSEPLLIELRGDRYVRYGGIQKSGQREVASAPDYSALRTIAGPKPVDLPPATLIYRDGHHEEVTDYAIVGVVMYARGDFWRNGYWTKNIQLSALNIPATLKTNQDNGVKFVLPAGPNEVVTRP